MFQNNQDVFEILSEAMSEGIVIVNEHQSIVATNSSAESLFDYTKEELLNKPLNLLIPQNYHADHGKHFNKFYKKSEKRRMGQGRDLHAVDKLGNMFPVEVGLNPFTVYGKTYVMALVIDITDRKKAEEEANHWSRIFNESLNEIYIFDAKTLCFINANQGAQKNIGYTLEELKKLTPVDIKPEYNNVQFREILQLILDGKDEKIKFETIHERKEGSTYPVEVHLQLSTLGYKTVFVAIILDITDRKNYTKKLEKTVEERTKQLKESLKVEKELNELKTKFLSLVSHEFKTPLTGILTSTMLLSKYKLETQQDKRDKHINTITSKVHYLNNILNDFLSVEKLEAGKVMYKFTTFKLSKVVNEVVYNSNMLLKEGQKINYPEDIDGISLTQDEKTIELALSNLVHNAIKYSPENTSIEIIIIQDENNTTFKVIDQGMGIPEKDQKNIFNRYFRAENALLSQGTGIGLNIVKTHIENLSGSISFESKENIGSTFTMTIPNTYIQ